MERQTDSSPLFSLESVKRTLEAGNLVITPNFRLARIIEEAWQFNCLQTQTKSWFRPNIRALEGWYDQLWDHLVDSGYEGALKGIPLSPDKERWFWQAVIEQDKSLAPNINPDNFVDIARKGWKLLHQWQLQGDDLNHYAHKGLDHLLVWGRAVEQAIADKGYISSIARLAVIEASYREGWLQPADNIVLAGFQTLPPQTEAVLQLACRNLETLSLGKRPPVNKTLFAAENIDEEISAAAQWAGKIRRQNPNAKVGIVVPQLSSLKDRVERIFRHHLEPSWCLPASPYRETPYNISAGTPLASTPIVASALGLTALLFDPLDVSQLCLLLKNPFWGDYIVEGDLRCQLIQSLLELGFHDVSGATLRALANQIEAPAPNCTEEKSLVQPLIKLATLARSLPKTADFKTWREVIVESLEILGWPGKRSPDSQEYQQLQHWQTLLEEFAELTSITGEVSLKQASKVLRHLAADCTFHPETQDSNLQVLGLLEAAGLEFDHLWLMNMDERQWPQATAPHPLIPVSLQRELKMPRACPEQELQLSRDLVRLFANSADNLVLSYARYEGDIECHPSALLRDVAEVSPETIDVSPEEKDKHWKAEHPWLRELWQSRKIEIIVDDLGPPFPMPEAYLRGGSRILADQAQCPFNAFVRWRLGAEPLPIIQSGISPQIRGQLVHGSLESIWYRLKDRDGLSAQSESELEQLVQSCVSSQINQLLRSYGETISRLEIGERLLKLEQQRLTRLLLRWLGEEMARPAFKAIELEKQVKLSLADIEISLRLDRVDQLADGNLVVIDYKTGASTSVTGLRQQRLVEPQLPLYGLAISQIFNQLPSALAYGVINPNIIGFKGISSSTDILPSCKGLADLDLPEDWQQTLDIWQKSAEGIVEEFKSGHAALNFYSQNALNYSVDLLPLNRLESRHSLWEDYAN